MLVASTNEGKVSELKQIFTNEHLVSLKEFGLDIDVEEDQDTILGNAAKKAIEISKLTNQTVIADDSGLFIEEYDGWPGVKTARFLGHHVPPRVRNEYILNKMAGLPKEKRKAKIVCVLVCCSSSGELLVGEGELCGYIATQIAGNNGFGFDEIFELEDGRVLATLDKAEKNTLSARYLASISLKNKMRNNHFAI